MTPPASRWRPNRRCALVTFLVGLAMGTNAKKVTCSEDLIIHQLALGPMKNFQYLLATTGGQAVVIDAAWDIDAIKNYAKKNALSLDGALYTHQHPDHVGGKMKTMPNYPAVPGAPLLKDLTLWIGTNDLEGAAEAVEMESSDWTPLPDGTVLKPFKNSEIEVLVIETPGHTVGGVSFLVRSSSSAFRAGKCSQGVLFTGDTLFADAAGRTDLPGGDEQTLLRSLSRLSALDEKVIVLPGHDYGPRKKTSIGEEIRSNNFMRTARQRYPYTSTSVRKLPDSMKRSDEL